MGALLQRSLVVLVALAGLGCPPEGIDITSPAPGEVLLSPHVDAEVAFRPRLRPNERVSATLISGIDDLVGGYVSVDLSDALAVTMDRRRATISISDLPPGRSELHVRRYRGRSRVSHAEDSIEIDRGGFFGPAGGPFGVGVITRTIERFKTRFPTELRQLDLEIWYPTDDPTAPVDPARGATPDAPLALGAEALPLIIFSHGNCGSALSSTFLTTDLSRAGYLVVAIHHTGNTSANPDCATLPFLVEALLERHGDVSDTLSHLIERNDDPSWPLAGALDPDRVGITGHSFGGQTVLRVADADPRVRAAMPMAPEGALFASLLPLPLPLMIQGAELDTTTPFQVNQADLYALQDPPRFLVEILGAGHGAFSDRCLSAPSCTDGSVEAAEVHASILAYARGFFGVYVVGDRRWSSLLAPQPHSNYTEDR